MNILVIGAGYWGQKLIERFGNILGVDHVGIYDKDPQRVAQYLNKAYFTVQGTLPHHPWLKGSLVDAVAIATPISSHYELAKEWLEAGRHVFVEKPLAQTAEQARELGRLAEEKGLVLMSDLTFLQDKRVEGLPPGSLRSMLWTGPASQTSDEGIFWTWAPHPLSIALLINGEPRGVAATRLGETLVISLIYGEKKDNTSIIMEWGDDFSKQRHLLTEPSKGVLEQIDLTRNLSRDPLHRTCARFVATVASMALSGANKPRLPNVISGVRVSELMAWINDEFLASGSVPTIDVKKWDRD